MTELLDDAPPRSLATDASIFLDFDGTLVDIASTPDAVVVTARLETLLDGLRTCYGGRLGLLTGRSIAQLERFVPLEGVAVGGSHGIERRWPDGHVEAAERPAALDDALAAMMALRERFPGILIEDKPFGIALHFRQAPEAAEEARALAERLAERAGLPLQPGKMLYEIKSAICDKGDALRAFMAEPPMVGTRPLFFGDDMTDEPGFIAAQEMGGAGILVGPPRTTGAQYRLADVAAVLAWLETACEAAA